MADPRNPGGQMSARQYSTRMRRRRAAQERPQTTARSAISQIVDYYTKNPREAIKMAGQLMYETATPTGMAQALARDVRNRDAAAVGLTAAGMVPFVGPVGKTAAAAGKVSKAASAGMKAADKAADASKVAQKAAGAARPRPITNTRAGGSSTGQAAGGSNRLSPREVAAKRRGTRKARSEEGARTLEAQEAAAAGRTSINTGVQSPVAPRPAGDRLPSTATDKRLAEIAAKRSEALKNAKGKGGRTKAEQKRSVEDVKETMRAQLLRRDRGARPGEDVPDAKGNLPVGNPQAAVASRPAGAATRPSGAAAAPKPGSAVVRTGRGSTTREATGRRPKRPSGAVARPKRPSGAVAQRPGSQVVRGEVVRERREPIDLITRPVRKPIGAIGSGRSSGSAAAAGGPRAAIGSGRQGAAAAGKAKKGRGKKALIGAAALAGAGLLAKQFDSDKSPTDAATKTTQSAKPIAKTRPASTLRDKYGRQISREEFTRREAYRRSLQGMSKKEKAEARKLEMKRREKYRASEGAEKFGNRATLMTRNMDLREGVSSRKVNRKMRAAAGAGGNRQAAMAARQRFTRKNK